MSAQVLDQTDFPAHLPPARAGGPAVVFHLEGELDLATAPGLGRALASALDERPSQLVLDLAGLTFLDSSGARVLVTTARRARDEGCAFVLRSPSASIMKMLRLVGLDRLLVAGPGTRRGTDDPQSRRLAASRRPTTVLASVT